VDDIKIYTTPVAWVTYGQEGYGEWNVDFHFGIGKPESARTWLPLYMQEPRTLEEVKVLDAWLATAAKTDVPHG
jgi:hypothetical protein